MCSRANKNNSRKGGRIQGGVEAEANLEGPLYPERPCMSGIFFMTSSWVGSPIMAPGNLEGRKQRNLNFSAHQQLMHGGPDQSADSGKHRSPLKSCGSDGRPRLPREPWHTNLCSAHNPPGAECGPG